MAPKNKRQRARAAITRKRAYRAAELASQGYSQTRIGQRIAAEEGLAAPLSQHTVSKLLAGLVAQQDVLTRDLIRSRFFTQIDQIEYAIEELFDAWRASKGPQKAGARSVSQRLGQTRTGKDGKPTPPDGYEHTSSSVRDSHGDAQYLRTAMSYMERLGKLLQFEGDQARLYLVPQTAHGVPQAGTVPDMSFDEMPPEVMRQYLLSMAEAARLSASPGALLGAPDALGSPQSNVVDAEVVSVTDTASDVQEPA